MMSHKNHCNIAKHISLLLKMLFATSLMKICLIIVCKMNIHKRCEKNVANDCGINKRDMANVLSELNLTSEKLSTKRKKVTRQ